jgi:hypothetical protein
MIPWRYNQFQPFGASDGQRLFFLPKRWNIPIAYRTHLIFQGRQERLNYGVWLFSPFN